MRWRFRVVAASILISSSLSAGVVEFSIDWYTIDAGGTLEMSGDDWELAGTLGQWDAHAEPSEGNGWQVQGGFWPWGESELLDVMFSDRFEQ